MNLTEFHFIRPYWLLSLLPYVALLVLLVRSKLSHGNWTAVCDEALLPYLLQDKAVSQSRWPLATGAVAALLAIVALAGPTWERLPTPVFRNDSALVIVLDLSRSMDAADIKPSRLVMARYKIADILKQRKDGQLALVVYAGDAFVVAPLTNDTETIANQLSALTTDIMPSGGNNTEAALEKAEALFAQAGLQKGQILLISDGGNVEDALPKLKSLEAYQLLVLGVGTTDGAPIALKSGGFLKDEQGNIIVAKLDASGLQQLAQAGNGDYQAITSDDTDIRLLFSSFVRQPAEKGEKNEKLFLDQWRDFGPYLLLLVLPLAAMCFRKGLLGVALLILVPLPKNSYAFDVDKIWQNLWQTKDQQAQAAYNKQDYAKAAELFENPDWKAAAHYKTGAFDKALEHLKDNGSANSFYNQGNALAKSGQYPEALEAYNKALKLNPKDEDAKFNKELVEKTLEKQKQDQQQQQQQNQQNKDDKQNSQAPKEQQQQQDGDPSDKSESANDQEQQGQQDKGDQKPEPKPEQSQESTERQPEKQESDKEKEPKNQPEPAKPEKAQNTDPQKDKDKPDKESGQAMDLQTSEQQQANEQWLKRIPDDPAGLLRRKFKYQYDQRERR